MLKVSLRTKRVKGVTILTEEKKTLYTNLQNGACSGAVLMLLHNSNAGYIYCDYFNINNILFFQLV